ncbi:MAG: YjgN family protein [Phaeospirillum sp.]|nr:YjgN family protein [Phaeospirillum sp.]
MTPEPIFPFRHHGRTGAAVRVALVNLGLNIVTLSFWRFWGRTNVRRLLWGGTSVWDDPVEYTGLGGELFKGFLLVLLVVYLPLLGLYGWAQVLIAAEDPRGGLMLAGLYPLTIFLIAVGGFRARRYQLSRTLWRGIRGGQTGSAVGYALRSMAVWVLVPLTLGWALPWGEMMLARYRLGHTTFGDRTFACDAGVKGLYARMAVMWLCGAVYLTLAVGFAVLLEQWGIEEEAGAFYLAMLALGAVFVLVVPWAWYRAAVFTRLAAGTSFDGHRFTAQVRTWPLIRLVLGNALISLFSLGVLRPWAAQRTFRFTCSVMAVDGVPDFAAIHQSADHGPSTGEGLVSVLDGAGEF